MGGSSSGLSPRSLWRNILLGSSIATCASRNKIAKHTKQFKQKLKEGQHILIKHIQNNLNKNQKKTQQILIKHILYTIAIRVPNTIIAEFWLFHLTTDLCFNDRSWVSYPNFFFFFLTFLRRRRCPSLAWSNTWSSVWVVTLSNIISSTSLHLTLSMVSSRSSIPPASFEFVARSTATHMCLWYLSLFLIVGFFFSEDV